MPHIVSDKVLKIWPGLDDLAEMSYFKAFSALRIVFSVRP